MHVNLLTHDSSEHFHAIEIYISLLCLIKRAKRFKPCLRTLGKLQSFESSLLSCVFGLEASISHPRKSLFFNTWRVLQATIPSASHPMRSH